MADQAVGLTHTALVPLGPIVRIPRTERSIISVEDGIIPGYLVAKLIRLLIVIKVSFTIVFTKSSSGMAGTTILEDRERGLIDFRRMIIPFLGQLARIGRGESMLTEHPSRQVPTVLGVEGIADDNFARPIRSALLEVIAVRYLVIVMAGTTGLPGTVGRFAISGERTSIESFQNNLFMQRDLG
jgi:hypothetical protein